MRRTQVLCDGLLETQAELTRVYEERDSYRNGVHDLQAKLSKTEAQLEEVETRNYTLTKDYEALERDNACLRRYLYELTRTSQDSLSNKVCDVIFYKNEMLTQYIEGSPGLASHSSTNSCRQGNRSPEKAVLQFIPYETE